MRLEHDALIVGAGGAGLWAALELAKAGADAAVLTKLYPTRSHTGAAQGGVCAALGNLEEDHWEWHMFDTIKGGDYLSDQDAAEILAREAIETVIVDYVKGGRRTLLLTGLYILAFVLFALGTAVVMTLPVVPKG